MIYDCCAYIDNVCISLTIDNERIGSGILLYISSTEADKVINNWRALPVAEKVAKIKPFCESCENEAERIKQWILRKYT